MGDILLDPAEVPADLAPFFETMEGGPNSVWTINPEPNSWGICSSCKRVYKNAPRECSCGGKMTGHFASFPRALVEPIVKVATSQRGCCPECGAQWARVVETETIRRDRPADRTARHEEGNGVNSCGNTVAGVSSRTLGWRPTCECNTSTMVLGLLATHNAVPPVVLDPFGGSGTTALVANTLGRDAILIELNPDYAALARERIGLELRPSTHRPQDNGRHEDAPLFEMA